MIENPNVYVFFDIDKKPRFIAETNWDGAVTIINAAQGKLYCRELKDDKLRVPGGIYKGQIGAEQLSNEEVRHLEHYLKDKAVQRAREIAVEHPLYIKLDEEHLIKSVPGPYYLQIPFGDGFMRIPTDDINTVKTMFDELLKIDGVKEIMEKYGVTFHEA